MVAPSLLLRGRPLRRADWWASSIRSIRRRHSGQAQENLPALNEILLNAFQSRIGASRWYP